MHIRPTGIESAFVDDELIVSKTDMNGRITYANEVFLRVSGFSERELLGAPHSIIRHPAMPRGVFRMLWDRLAAGKEIFAYVINLAKNGDHYWVFAHVTPSFDGHGKIVGYHSNRRVPHARALKFIEPLYATLLDEEARQPDKVAATEAGLARLNLEVSRANTTYDELIFSLQ